MRLLITTVTAADAGQKLKTFLLNRWHLSSSLLKSLKWRENAILVNGIHVPVSFTLRDGDEVTVDISDTASVSVHVNPTDFPLDILYEDDDLLILNKPSGISIHSSSLTDDAVTIAGAVSFYLNGSSFHPVNRLDRGVTGVMVVAKSGYIHHRCMAMLHSEKFHREYRGICSGIPSPPSGAIDLPIGRDPDSILKRRIDPNGLKSRTEYEVLYSSSDRSLLRLRPLTGRTHQIRLHCAALGHPLLGDWLYGVEDCSLITRPALHSYELWLQHPLTDELVHVIAPLPDDFKQILP